MLLVTEVVVFVTSARSPRVLATNRRKVIDLRDKNPGIEINALARRRKSEVGGFKSQCPQGFSHENSVKVSFCDPLVVDFVHYTSVSCIMYLLTSVHLADVP